MQVELFEKFMDAHDKQIDLLVEVIERQGTRISNLEQKLGQNSDLERAVLAQQWNKLERERIAAVMCGDAPASWSDGLHYQT